MKRIFTFAAVLTVAALVLGAFDVTAITGNGAPSGPHYNLNIIGVKDKNANLTGGNGRRIFVKLWGSDTKILLQEGPDFAVLDANGTDGTAKFQLPDPDPDDTGTTAYSVYARALGKPNRSAEMTSCFQDSTGTWCSTESVMLIRNAGKSTFENVTKELLTICVDSDLDTKCDARVGLFDDAGAAYWWDYDNYGLKLAQLRFYPIPYNVGTTP